MGDIRERQSKGIPLATLVDGGTPDVPTAESFLARLGPADRATVQHVVRIVNQLSIAYNGEKVNYPGFFAVYGIGGNVTKQGERPDVDLLIVTSAYWHGGYTPLIERKMARLFNENRWDEYDKLRSQSSMDEDFDYDTEEGISQASQARKIEILRVDFVCGTIRDQM